MQEIESLLRQLDAEDNVHALRGRIVDFMFKSLDSRRESLDDWEKIHFANAIGSLGLNIHSRRQPSKDWLRLCLSDMGQALTPKAKRNSGYIAHGIAAAELSYEQLLQALSALDRNIRAQVQSVSEYREHGSSRTQRISLV